VLGLEHLLLLNLILVNDSSVLLCINVDNGVDKLPDVWTTFFLEVLLYQEMYVAKSACSAYGFSSCFFVNIQKGRKSVSANERIKIRFHQGEVSN